MGRLGAGSVVGIRCSEKYSSGELTPICRLRTKYERCGYRQFPRGLAIYKRQVYEDSPIDFLLIFRNLINNSELPGNSIACVAQEGKLQLVLISHKEGVVHCLG